MRYRRLILPLLTLGGLSFSSITSSAQDSQPSGSPPPEKQPPQIDLENLDGISAFEGISFGSEFAKAKGLTLEEDRGSLKIYKKENAKATLGPALLDTVLYYFFEGKFYGVAFHTDDGQDTILLREIFGTAFGPGQNSAEGGPSTAWIGKKNGAIYEANTATGEGNAFLFNIQLHDAYLKYESDSIKKAVEQLVKGK